MCAVLFFLGIFVYSSAYENLALMKPTWQSSSHNTTISGSHKAVDGLKTYLTYHGGQCGVTANKRTTATWWVNLTHIQRIQNIMIHYRTDHLVWNSLNQFTGRFMGFSLYVSNTTNMEDGHLCFHDRNYTRATIPPIVNISCPVPGQYVIYYNERPARNNNSAENSLFAFAELCEVEVYGCSDPRRYGSNCSSVCPQHCDGFCDIQSGNCLRCLPGFAGERCEECVKHAFGMGCNLTCGYCKDFETCNQITGSCSNGCADGFEGLLCRKECNPGFYGANCNSQCGNCKNEAPCNSINGTCLGGCAEGFEGLLCNKECSNGWYRSECQGQCGYCKDHRPCHHVTGSCYGACEPGYSGDTCKENVFTQLLANQKDMLNLMREFISYGRHNVKMKENGTSPTELI